MLREGLWPVVVLVGAIIIFATGRAFGLDFFGLAPPATGKDALLAQGIIALVASALVFVPLWRWKAPVYLKAQYIMWLSGAVTVLLSMSLFVGGVFRPGILMALSNDVMRVAWGAVGAVVLCLVSGFVYSATRPPVESGGIETL